MSIDTINKIDATDTLRFAPPHKRADKFAEGIIKVYRLPEESDEEQFRHWWCPQTDGNGQLLVPARISPQEKARYQEAEFANLITSAGRTQVLTYIGASSGNSTGFSKYLALGTGAIQAPSPADTTLATETFR